MRNYTKLLMLFVLCLVGMQGNAQNVTIRGNNGNLIPAVKDYGTGDSFYAAGGYATWQHEQLCMVMTVSDNTNLTPNGQLDNPANNIFKDGDNIQIAHGLASDANVCYVSISLPSGYRFTGYSITFSKPRQLSKGRLVFNDADASSTFGETVRSFASYIPDTHQDSDPEKAIVSSADVSRGGASRTIKREGTEENMSNVLYFKLQNPSSTRALINIEHAEFWFTAEENYTPLTPASPVSSVSAVKVPFSTSKVDFGRLESNTYQNATRISYSSANVTDLEANFDLYEAESITDGAGVDGITGQVVDYKEGSISSVGGYFKFDSPDQEQVYFIETPTYVEVSDGSENPVGYRIVGAEFDYATSITASRTFYITYTYTGSEYPLSNGTKFYLGTNGRFDDTPVIWEMDGEGFISTGSGNNKRYLYFNNGRIATQTAKPSNSERFAIDENNNIYQTGWPTYFIRTGQITTYQTGSIWNRRTYVDYIEGLINPDDYPKAMYEQIETSSSSVGNFTLKVYDKEGANPETINVTGNGTYELTGLNNDAVKFGIIGTGLVRATLTLQALDPYLDQMQVVCQDEVQTVIRMEEGFTASDFSVSGGEFHFYLPTDCNGHQVAITFEDLNSKYFDETYPDGHAANKSRLNFVKSLHYDAFGASNNNVYTNVGEAKNATLERLKVGVVGTTPFKFNNAADIGTQGGTYREYPFSLEKYADSPNSGSFSEFKFTVSSTPSTQTRYVFTTDETRYNIAPTTATQHRAYAFYTMKVTVETGTYEPKVTFEPIYAYTNYDNSAESGGSTDENKAFYGAKVTASDGNGKAGYSSINEIYEVITNAVGKTNAPETTKQILYIDMTEMAGIYEGSTVAYPTAMSVSDFLSNHAKNSLVFLPVGVSASGDNVVYQLSDKSFKAANNIVLTDKQPFYSPYNIQVDQAKYAKYTRVLTYADYGKDVKAMVMLPYALTVANGKHTNPAVAEQQEGKNSFWVKEMKAASLVEQTRSHDYGIAYFENVNGAKTAANRPYMVLVDEASVEGDVSFVAIEKGALIQATSGMSPRNGTGENGAYKYDYLYTGETVSGSLDTPGMNVTLTSEGSYSGQKYDRADSEKIFYFANNSFYNLYKLMKTKRYLYIYPFHPVYSFTGNASSVNKLGGIDVTFEPLDLDGIRDMAKVYAPDLAVKSGKGYIQFTSDKDQTVNILSLNGTSYSKVTMNAGDSKTINLPAGVYVVNNVKIIVK